MTEKAITEPRRVAARGDRRADDGRAARPSPPMPTSARPTNAPAPAAAPRSRAMPTGLIGGGVAVMLLFGAALGGWAALAPIDGAVVAQGVVRAASHRKVVTHLEGGVIDAILVGDGDTVSAGDSLVRLRPIEPASAVSRLEQERALVEATIARLQSEKAALAVRPSRHVRRAPSAGVPADGLTAEERALLERRRAVVAARRQQITAQIREVEAAIARLTQQAVSTVDEQGLVEDQLDRRRAASADAASTDRQVFRLSRSATRVDRSADRLLARIAERKNRAAELRAQLRELTATTALDIEERLYAARNEAFDLAQRLAAAEDKLERTEIVSPIDGRVVDLKVRTVGGALQPGAPVLEIVPIDDELVLEVAIDPSDIDEIVVGQAAKVELTAQGRRRRAPIDGVVTEISADSLRDEATGALYYRGLIRLSAESVDAHPVDLIAGMEASAFIRTEARSALDYLLSPLSQAINRGLRES